MVTDASDQVFDALGAPTRRAILRALRDGPRAVGEIAATLPVSRPAVSKHLKVLSQAGLVAVETRGTRNEVRLAHAGFDVARRTLDDFWDVALMRFAAVVDAETP